MFPAPSTNFEDDALSHRDIQHPTVDPRPRLLTSGMTYYLGDDVFLSFPQSAHSVIPAVFPLRHSRDLLGGNPVDILGPGIYMDPPLLNNLVRPQVVQKCFPVEESVVVNPGIGWILTDEYIMAEDLLIRKIS